MTQMLIPPDNGATAGEGASVDCGHAGLDNSQGGISCFERFLGYHLARPVRIVGADFLILFVGFTLLIGSYFLPLLDGPVVLSGAQGDVSYYWLWARGLLGESIRQWRVPLWNPFIMSGTPFLASNQAAFFYPLNWLYAIIPTAFLLNAQMVFHFWFGLAAMYILGRNLRWSPISACLAALVFGFSGFAILRWHAGHLPFVTEWPWTPLSVLAWLRLQESASGSLFSRRTLFAGLMLSGILAIQFFSGHPQIVYFTLLILAALQIGWLIYAFRSRCGRQALVGSIWLAAALLFSGLLSSVQALPTVAYSPETVRSQRVSKMFKESQEARARLERFYTEQSQPPSDFVTAFAPWAFGGRPNFVNYIGSESYWELSAYVGAAAFTLALIPLLVPGSVTGCAMSMVALLLWAWLLAFGEYAGAYHLLFNIFPGLSLFRNPGRFLYIVTFCFAVLSATGLETMFRLARQDCNRFWTALSRLTVTVVAGYVVFQFVFADGVRSPVIMKMLSHRISAESFMQLDRPAVAEFFAGYRANILAGFAVAGATICFLTMLASRRSALAGRVLVVAICLFELVQFARPYGESFYPERLEWSEKIREVLKKAGSRYRIGSARLPSDLNQGMVQHVQHIWGYEPTVSFDYSAAISVSQGNLPGFAAAWLTTAGITPFTNALGLRYLLCAPTLKPTNLGWQPVTQSSDWVVFENPNAIPRGFTVGLGKRTQSDRIAEAVNASDFIPTQTVLLEEELPREAAEDHATTTPGDVRILRDEPEQFEAEVSMRASGWFVLMDQMLPGWTAKVDGSPVKMYRGNAVGRALHLTTGVHRVAMTYDAPGFRLGALLSGLSWSIWLLTVAALLFWRRVEYRESFRSQCLAQAGNSPTRAETGICRETGHSTTTDGTQRSVDEKLRGGPL